MDASESEKFWKMLFEDMEPKFSEEESDEQATFIEMRSKKALLTSDWKGAVPKASSGITAKNSRR
jgi:hypothetical protein